jgi:UDP-N-acetylglucosamine 2-epimerase (non-hydrolysing)
VKVLSVVGARPQFVKAWVVSEELRSSHEEILVHTGQHYDEEMSKVFFDELGIPEPDYNLGVGSGSHGAQTAEMIVEIERVVEAESPDVILTYGDTNSTLATAVVGSKADAELAHVEAGLRSHNREMPEEVNRVLTDHGADYLFAPSEQAAENLRGEGIDDGVHFVGDVMYESLQLARERAGAVSTILDELGVEPDSFTLATIHRPRNTDDHDRLRTILTALDDWSQPVVLPAHPRTRQALDDAGIDPEELEGITVTDPAGYVDFVQLMDAASRIATDSGGIQKEALFLDTPCITFREETEWDETLQHGWNRLVGADYDAILDGLSSGPDDSEPKPEPYGDGTGTEQIRRALEAGEGRS